MAGSSCAEAHRKRDPRPRRGSRGHGPYRHRIRTIGQRRGRLDRSERGRLTLKHGPIPNVEVDGGTLELQVADPALHQQVREGDRVRLTRTVSTAQLPSPATTSRPMPGFDQF
ncbi:copper-binding protein, partial [Proteus mirabilis]|uniref:copper-binding protein n=1 Tax=Proteus mirabilis TaxID=584 RepID=UPI0013D5D95E